MDLGMAVMTAGNAIVCTGGFYLVVFDFSIGKALFFKSGLEKSAAPAAAIIVGSVGLHIDKIFFAHNRPYNKSEVFGNGIAIAFPDNLTRILNRELNLQVLVPVGIDRQFSLANPFGVVFINIFYFKVVFKVVLFQSCQD
jgi:hypothetical protein